MVVLASSICTRGGKPLLSRQFRDLNKDKITQLLANFPSLISNSSNQHTAVEDEAIRYVYQPLEEFYVILLTNKQSNILQDIDTLHLFVSTISNLLRNVEEKEIFDNAFEILSSFDEIINNGYKENLTMAQVQTFLEMDSHEEKIQEIIERNKEMEAIEERKRKAKEIQRKELAKRNLESQYGNAGVNGQIYNPTPATTYQPMQPQINSVESFDSYPKAAIPRAGGLQLGKRTKGESTQPLLPNQQPIFHQAVANENPKPSLKPATPVTPKVVNNGILITINEKFNVNLSRDGLINLSEIKGDLQLRINDAILSNCKILLKTDTNQKKIQYKTHPNVDKNLFNDANIIGLKDKAKSFPSNDQSLGVLRWRCVGGKDDDQYLPIILTAWVNLNDNSADVTLEYELTSKFIENNPSNTNVKDLKIVIPLGGDVNLKDDDKISYEHSDIGVIFTIDEISTDDPSGSFEFTIEAVDEDSLFPMDVKFDINYTEFTELDNCFGNVKVVSVVSNEEEESLPFELHANLASEVYEII